MYDLKQDEETIFQAMVPRLSLSDKATADRPFEILGLKLSELV
jgi:hypothetical protein